jgi:hypothetical protein
MATPLKQLHTPHRAPGPFASRPQQFPKTQKKAADVVQQLHRLMQKGPRSLVATVIDTSFQPSMGYVLCTTQLGVVPVYGVPYGSVVPQMRLFTRQLGPAATNRGYVFDGFAPAMSVRGLTSGSVVYTTTNGDSGTPPASTSVGGLPSSASVTSATGYYWHFFFYLPSLPAIPRVTLFSMTNAGATNVVACEYLSNGQLVFRCTNDGHAFTNTSVVAPHSIHWVQIQPGLAGGIEFLVDGVAAYAASGGGPTFAGSGATYTTYFLSNADGSQPCPIGTWLSKWGYGYSYTGGNAVALSTGLTTPAGDSDLPNLNVSSTQKTQALYLCTDTPGSATVINSSAAGTGSSLSLATSYSALVGAGPY